jgi:homoserine kinase type II
MLIKQTLSKNALKVILARFDLGKILKIEPVPTSGNIAYAIKTKDKKYFLRLSPEGKRARSQGEIAAELEFIRYLKKNKLPVVGPIKMKNGEEIIALVKHRGYLREFIRAEAKLAPSIKEIELFGEMLGWVHSVSQNYETKNKRKHIWNLSETQKYFIRKKQLILKSDFKGKNKFIDIFEKEIFSLDFPKKPPKGMIHEDLGKRHILWKKGKITAIMDFDRCYFGNLIDDLGQACRGWCFTDDWKKWSNDNFKALLRGYQKKRRLTNLEKHKLIDSIKFAILERALSFCVRYTEITHDSKDREYALYSISPDGLLGVIEKKRSNLEKIMKKLP